MTSTWGVYHTPAVVECHYLSHPFCYNSVLLGHLCQSIYQQLSEILPNVKQYYWSCDHRSEIWPYSVNLGCITPQCRTCTQISEITTAERLRCIRTYMCKKKKIMWVLIFFNFTFSLTRSSFFISNRNKRACL